MGVLTSSENLRPVSSGFHLVFWRRVRHPSLLDPKTHLRAGPPLRKPCSGSSFQGFTLTFLAHKTAPVLIPGVHLRTWDEITSRFPKQRRASRPGFSNSNREVISSWILTGGIASWPHTSTCLDPNHAPDGRDRSRAWAAYGLFALDLFPFTWVSP